MNVASVSEITATSQTSFDDAIETGIQRAIKTLRNVRSAWVKDHEVIVDSDSVAIWKVTLKVTFVLDE